MTVFNINGYDNTENNCRKIKKYARRACNGKSLKRRLPILEWLPKYTFLTLLQDVIAGITVGLTAIPQGIAYAVLAGLSPEYGLYASLTSGFIYIVFGSCKDVTVGPTAILASMIARYVSDHSPDFAILAAFLSGVIQLIIGVFHLGFLIEFISIPVISGFTTAAALQIAASQLKSLFGLSGPSGNTFAESVYNFVFNIKTAKLWEPILGFSTVVMLILLQKLGAGCKSSDGVLKSLRWFISLARNAIVVVVGMIIAYILKVMLDTEPLLLIGDIDGGLPKIGPPPFSTIGANNETYTFIDMLQVLGPQIIVLPFVAIIESVAIAKAFSDGGQVDATQELIALGLCNIVGSFAQSMPITGSFTRTALNYASGVQTQAGGVAKCLLLIVALTSLSSTFYFIPKASLAGLIITAMYSLLDIRIYSKLWRNSKKELFLLIITTIVCLIAGLEYGIVTGVLIEAAFLLYATSRPSINVTKIKSDKGELLVMLLTDKIAYSAAEHIRRAVLRISRKADKDSTIVIDGTNLQSMDTTVASNMLSAVESMEKKSKSVLFLNFNSVLRKLCSDLNSNYDNKFVTCANVHDLTESLPKVM